MVEKYTGTKLLTVTICSNSATTAFRKDVVIVQSDFDLNRRILQALILSQYKHEVAAKNEYRINLKPVILFKAHRTIEQSTQNKTNFHRLIDELTA